MGIDPSINSTGICINDDGNYIYYNIVGHMTKKMSKFEHPNISIIDYQKESEKLDNYVDKETQKMNNIYKICLAIEDIIEYHNPDIIQMEGVSYGSVGSAALVDLAGLNFSIRMVVKKFNKKLVIVSPTSVKKMAVANGQADKNVMIDAWKRIDKNISNVSEIKIDDLADSFFISRYEDNR